MRISYVIIIESNVLSWDKHEKLVPSRFFSGLVQLYNVN